MIFGNYQEESSNIVAETIFAGKQVEELPLQNCATRPAFGSAEILHLPEDGFMCDSPRYRGDGQR
jgi:hypothetical protein